MSDFLPQPPEDFVDFWRGTYEDAKAVKLDYHRSLTNDFDWPGFIVETISFRGILGRPVEGWIAYPQGARRIPSFLWVPPYGRESLLPNAYGTREGFCSMSLNLHGESAFHQEKYAPPRGYFSEGADDPETFVFRRMFQDCVIAARVLQAQTEADEDKIAAFGMSQGAGLGIWLGAWSPVVKAVCADMPFFSAIVQTLKRQFYRYPLKELMDYMEELPLGEARVMNTLGYYDTLHHAQHCKVPTLVTLGQKDPACRPDAVTSVYQALPGEKKLIEYPGGHDWDPAMVANNRDWALEWL